MTGSPAHAGIDRDTGRNRRQANGFPAHAGIDRDTGRNRRQANGFPAHAGVQACQIVSPVARSRAAMMVCRSQPTKQVTSSPPWSRS